MEHLAVIWLSGEAFCGARIRRIDHVANVDRPGILDWVQIYIWFLFVACVWTTYRMLRVWYRVPPFFVRSLQSKDPGYFKLLEHSTSSFTRWSVLIFLGWGLVAATAIYRMSFDLQRGGAISAAEFLSPVGDLSASLCAALWVVLFLYLARWHLLNRIERYHRQD